MIKIDSHHHLWQYDPVEYAWIGENMSVLRRNFLVEDLDSTLGSAGVSGAVSVQARQSIEETAWLLDIAGRCDRVLGVVGWLPLASDTIETEIERFAGNSWLKGLRHVVQDEVDPRFLLGEAFNRGVACIASHDLVYDLLIYSRQLEPTIEFVDRHPKQRFVLDHIAKPTIRSESFDDAWEQNLRALAKRPHVSCKFSGVATEIRDADWDIETIRRYWDVTLAAFGPSRIMFGSDWPVCLLRTSYESWVHVVSEFASDLSPHERECLWSRNAIATYKLDVSL